MEPSTRYIYNTIQELSTALKNLVEQYCTKLKKYPHEVVNINNTVHVVKRGKFDWTRDFNEPLEFKFPSVKGIYRFTLTNYSSDDNMDEKFNITYNLKTIKDNFSYQLCETEILKGVDIVRFKISLNSTIDTEASFRITHPNYNIVRERL